MIGSKRNSSALSPTQPDTPLPPEFPGGIVWETEQPTLGAKKLYQNPNLATAPDMGLQQEKQAPKSSMLLGLPTSDPAERSSPTGFGEFLQACRWCKKTIEEESHVYMYGYLGAFCSPACREVLIKLDTFVRKRCSKSGQVDKGTEHVKEK